jgi:hypothetical protein
VAGYSYGLTLAAFLDDFPTVTREQAIAALNQAEGRGTGSHPD